MMTFVKNITEIKKIFRLELDSSNLSILKEVKNG